MYPSIDTEYQNDGSIQRSHNIECRADPGKMLKDPMRKNVSNVGLGGPILHILRFILVFIFNVPMVKKINTIPAHLYQNGFLPQDVFSVDLVYGVNSLSITVGSSTEFEFAQVGIIQVTHPVLQAAHT